MAAADTVVISGATQRLVPGMFLLHDLGTPPLKGVTTPIRAHAVLQATGVRSRLDVDPATLTPLVGRDQEFGLLHDSWEQVTEGQGRVVLIMGDPGIGKTRLVQTMVADVADRRHALLELRCSEDRANSPLYPVISLLWSVLGWSRGDSDATRQDKLLAFCERYRISTTDGLPLLASLLSLPPSPRRVIGGPAWKFKFLILILGLGDRVAHNSMFERIKARAEKSYQQRRNLPTAAAKSGDLRAAPESRSARRKYFPESCLPLVMGVLMIIVWTVLIATGQHDFQAALYESTSLLAAEALTALALVVGSIGILVGKQWGNTIHLSSLGMMLYTSVNSIGVFAQAGAIPASLFFAGITVITMILKSSVTDWVRMYSRSASTFFRTSSTLAS